MTDRSTKILLALVAIALWGLLLRPFLTLPPAQAQVPGNAAAINNGSIAIPYEGKPIIVVHDGKISAWSLVGNKLKRDSWESLP